jgi:hypothetical protein
MMAAVPNLLDQLRRISIVWIRRWLTGARSCKALPLASPIIRFGSCDKISDRRRRRSTVFRGFWLGLIA